MFVRSLLDEKNVKKNFYRKKLNNLAAILDFSTMFNFFPKAFFVYEPNYLKLVVHKPDIIIHVCIEGLVDWSNIADFVVLYIHEKIEIVEILENNKMIPQYFMTKQT